MLILNGREVADEVRAHLALRVENFERKTGRPPHLVVMLVGEDPASQVYVRNKHLACQKIGMASTVKVFPRDLDQTSFLRALSEFNQDPAVDGILVQLPLPAHLSNELVAENLSPTKDADGLTYGTMGRLFAGRSSVKSCTPLGIMRILEHYKIPVVGKRAVVIGRSLIVGKPMFHLLTEAQATVTLCHSKTENLREHTTQADLVVVAAGQARFLGRDDFKQGSVVIDVGMHGTGQSGKLCGDVRFEELNGWVSAATPVPGGVGPMTITSLLENTLVLAELRVNRP
ncbi:MAG: bifunctional methylenetetrahydrofolate dehydrogenase/methenyltetrahydrofolate cyclohydrolase FolD [Bdellovibrionaceae bacterium]|nr:bifunctional methylenetetrahydrofolate dehydrogenase/methenyltetrahydrofolate cyclohydrolase FolD [Pseudobdellovibrionaceae bacterium]